ALSFSLNSPLAERTENHQALATGTSYNPHTSEHSEWLTKWLEQPSCFISASFHHKWVPSLPNTINR
ncbi:hypothetical protein Lal_00023582, partial [Lupinus albus]